MNDSDVKFFRSLKRSTMKEINVMQLCRVVSISGTRANVQPLAVSNNSKSAMIMNALITQHSLPDMGIGQVVIVGFCDNDIDNYRGAADFPTSSNRMHSVNDAVILGVIA